jgi:xylulokinase
MGALGGDQAFVSLGTSGVLFAANDQFRPKPDSAVHAFCHALPGRWHQMGVILSATASLNWLAQLCNADPAALVNELGPDLRAPGPVTFLPYLAGERTPHNDALVRGAFAGLGGGRVELTQAVLEGVTFALADCRDALQTTPTAINRVTVVGGGSNSPYWRKLVATVLDIPVDVPAHGDFGAALGAARLGMVAATGADPATVMTPPPIVETIAPESGLREAFDVRLAKFRQFYPAIRTIFP